MIDWQMVEEYVKADDENHAFVGEQCYRLECKDCGITVAFRFDRDFSTGDDQCLCWDCATIETAIRAEFLRTSEALVLCSHVQHYGQQADNFRANYRGLLYRLSEFLREGVKL